MDNNFNPQQQMNFDPQTGQPVNPQPQMRFDPQTGQPVNPQPQMRFDPQTGQPVYQQPMSPQPPVRKKSKKGLVIGLSVGAAVIVIAAVVIVLIVSGVFLSKPDKVLRAFGNTFEAPPLLEDLDTASIFQSGTYHTDVAFSTDDFDLELTYNVTDSAKGLDAFVSISDGWFSAQIRGAAILDSEKLAVQIPTLGNNIYVYNYTQENTGYISEVFSEEEIEYLNGQLKAMALSGAEEEELSAETAKIFLSEFRNLSFSDAPKRNFTVDGSERSCKGYQTVITRDNVNHIIDQLEALYGDEGSELLRPWLAWFYMGSASNLEGFLQGSGEADYYEEMKKSFEDMPDITATFYIYKNQIACVTLMAEGEEISVQFQGGDRPTQNMRIELDGEVITVTGYTDGETEYTSVVYDGEQIGFLNYNASTGKVEAGFADDYKDYSMDATITKTRDALTIIINDVKVGDLSLSQAVDFDCVITWEKGAEIVPFEGTAYDVGNMSEEDLEAIVDDIENDLLY